MLKTSGEYPIPQKMGFFLSRVETISWIDGVETLIEKKKAVVGIQLA